jgi:uncharacterized protein (UPF0212 family)
MRALSASELLYAWERAAGLPLAGRSLVLLSVCAADASIDALARLTIGQRNARLLELRVAMFGVELATVTECPVCRERVEAGFSADRIRGADVSLPEICTCEVADYVVQFRLPNSRDLESLSHITNVDDARIALIDRLVVGAARRGEIVSARSFGDEVVTALGAEMDRLDPNADIRLSFECPHCAHRFDAGFDIGSFLWAELDAWAARMLGEVHELASAYGWSEHDILEMSAARRQAYLHLIAQ